MSAQPSQKSRRVLVADDDQTILRLITSIIEKAGYVPVTVRDGREALKVLQKDADFAACIFDVMMPHMQGPEVIRYMRSDQRLANIPVMIMTAQESPRFPTDGFSAGAIVFLPKPFKTSQLQSTLRLLLSIGGRDKQG